MEHRRMIVQMRRPWLWTNCAVVSLGAWLATGPFTFGYTGASALNDFICGLLLMTFSGLALMPRFDTAGRWAAAAVATWLQFAPLVFWPPAAVYINDTLVGALALILSVLVPMMPGMAHHMAMEKPGPDIPPGWSYNPSSWHQRAPMIALALVGWLISRYLAAFQLGYSQHAFDPFFGEGTRRVLSSNVSQMWPISDAGLGAFAYTFEMLMGWMGGRDRWRTMPWMVIFFFILVVPLGLVHIVLVILQPVVVGSWCSLCLAAALVMLLMIPLAVDEVIASLQFLRQSVRRGLPFWRTFFIGDTAPGGEKDRRSPHYGARARKMIPPALLGISAPANLMLCAGLGVWLMFAPAVLGVRGRAADSDHVAGAVVLTLAVISLAEVARSARWLLAIAGFWVCVSGVLFNGSAWNLPTGLLLILLSVPRGLVRERYAQWDRLIV